MNIPRSKRSSKRPAKLFIYLFIKIPAAELSTQVISEIMGNRSSPIPSSGARPTAQQDVLPSAERRVALQ